MFEKLFFLASRNISAQLTETFDFIWPTAAAMWNLRWQVDGFLRNYPEADVLALKNRFVIGSGIDGANLKRSCVDWSWEKQQEQFAKFLLIEFCALYEAWIDAFLIETQQNKNLAKQLQLPTNGQNGIRNTLIALQANISQGLSLSIYPTLQTNKKYSPVHLDQLLICYRYFKECRNAIIHRGGLANQITMDAYSKYAGLSAASLGLKEMPHHVPIIKLGDKIQLSLRGVVGFGDVILRIISTVDVELSKTSHAESTFYQRWISINGNRCSLPKDPRETKRFMIGLVRRLGLPAPRSPEALIPLLKKKGLVF